MKTMTELIATAVADYKAERDEAVAECERLNERVRVLEAALRLIEAAPEVMMVDANGHQLVGIARAALRGTK